MFDLAEFLKLKPPRRFSLDEIRVSTNNFDKENILGTGGEGEVYKGYIQMTVGETSKEVVVAIKCLTSNSRKDKFQTEIDLVSGLHHQNLVSLTGYCQEHDHWILVYEYIHNGSLADNLYPTCSLSWIKLLNICIGVAHGLDYLHKGSSAMYKIIHRDVKPSNILLDENWDAKLSDFGLSKRGLSLNDKQQSDPIKTYVRGTFGYYAPEYVFNREISRKTDVYAFGIVLLEVLCRKRREWPLHDSSSRDSNKEVEVKEEEEDIGTWARRNIATDLKNQISIKCLDNFIDIAGRCLLRDPKQRPNMAEAVQKLKWSLRLQNSEGEAKYTKSTIGKKTGLPPLPRPPQVNENASSSSPSGCEDGVVLYYSSYNSTSGIFDKSAEDSILVRAILKELLRVKVDERNMTKYEEFGTERSQELYCYLRLPHIYMGGKYVGVGSFIELYLSGILASFLGGSHIPVSLVCDSCGYARTCLTCVRSSRFVVCKVCATLTMLPRGEEKRVKCCSNCGSTQLFLRTLILTSENNVCLHGDSLSCDQHLKEVVYDVPLPILYGRHSSS